MDVLYNQLPVKLRLQLCCLPRASGQLKGQVLVQLGGEQTQPTGEFSPIQTQMR